MIKGTNIQKDTTLVNIYTSNIITPKYVKQNFMDIKGKIDKNTVIVWNFNTPLTSLDISSRHEINTETVTLSDTLAHRDVIDIYIAFHPKATKYV